MRKLLFLSLVLTLFLTFPTPARSEFYVIRLKNGNSLATPLYWSEGGLIYFFYVGGTVGVEKQIIEKVEKYKGERNFSVNSAAPDAKETKELPTTPATAETSPGPEKSPVVKVPEQKVNIAEYKDKKDKMTVELENLLERRREARQRRDKEEEARLTAELRQTSTDIYGITDEITAKNKGKLPEGWWEKK